MHTLSRSVGQQEIAATAVAVPSGLTVKFSSISKRFGSVRANDGITLSIESGGIHAIVGENGAGKSTLMKLLSGCYQPDAGEIYLNGRRLKLRSPADARGLGIGMVHQRFTLVPALSVLENILLGDRRLPFALDRRKLCREVDVKARELGFQFNLDEPAGRLSMADKQKLEIFKLLWRGARIIILDEPTSQLSPFEAEEVLSVAGGLAAGGKIVIFISHHIQEVLQHSYKVTVLSRGRVVASKPVIDVSADEMARLMVSVEEPAASLGSGGLDAATEPILELKGVSVSARDGKRGLTDLSLSVKAGEMLGIAGLAGSGQDMLASFLAGLVEPAAGEVLIGTSPRGPAALKDLAAAYIPADQTYGSIASMSVAENFSVRKIVASNALFLRTGLLRKQAAGMIQEFNLKPASPDAPAQSLSGGNLQRLIVGRELLREAPVLVADNPCAGLDIAMTRRVRHLLRRAALNGKAVVLISPDIDELMSTCDRIAVMCNGKITGCLPAAELDSQSLGLLMGGIAEEVVWLFKQIQIGEALADDRVGGALAKLKASGLAWQRQLAERLEPRLVEHRHVQVSVAGSRNEPGSALKARRAGLRIGSLAGSGSCRGTQQASVAARMADIYKRQSVRGESPGQAAE